MNCVAIVNNLWPDEAKSTVCAKLFMLFTVERVAGYGSHCCKWIIPSSEQVQSLGRIDLFLLLLAKQRIRTEVMLS